MKRMDARTLSPDAQEALRRRVVYSIRMDRLTLTAAARLHGVSRQSVAKWSDAVRTGGVKVLKSRKRGPRPAPRLLPAEVRAIQRAIRDDCPDQLRLPFALWSREAVVALIQQQTGQKVSVWTAGRYLKRWGYTIQKPMRRACERDDAQVKGWLHREYPSIKAEARRKIS